MEQGVRGEDPTDRQMDVEGGRAGQRGAERKGSGGDRAQTPAHGDPGVWKGPTQEGP